MWPPVGGTFWFQIFIQASSPEICRKTISGAEGGPGGEMGWPVFGLPPWKKIIGGVIAIISFRPGGWMQQSTVPRCAILSVGSTGDTSCEAARLHWAYRRRGGDMAARGGRAAGRDAGRRPSRSDNGPGIRGAGGAVSVRRKAEKIRRPFPTASDHFI